MDFKDLRVKGPVKSFRDLEVYQKTVELASNIRITFNDDDVVRIAEQIPELIAVAYDEKYEPDGKFHEKLTQAVNLIVKIITKIDLERARFKDDAKKREVLDMLLTKYQKQKRKILNLRKAWDMRGEKVAGKSV